MSTPNTIKVKPWGDDQGDFVLINEGDFDAAVHQLHGVDESTAPAADTTEAAGDTSADVDQAPAQAAPAAKTTRKARAAAPAADTTEG